MVKELSKRLKKYKIDVSSELGQRLKKLDEVYQRIEDVSLEIKKLNSEKEQLLEDAEMMELLLMHKFNKDSRNT
jgi:hypothetical protein